MTASHETRAAPREAEARVSRVQRRTVRLLVAAQIVGGIGIGVSASIGSLLAESVAHSDTYAGLARTATTAGAAVVGIPLALLAQRRGRRAALSTGWLAATVGGVVLIASAVLTSIPLLVVGMLLFGVGGATNQQSRYAAADLAAPHHRARALSIVVWATTVGSVIGPNLADPGARVASVLRLPSLTGAFVLATLCVALASLLLWAGLRPDPLLLAQQRADTEGQPRAGARTHVTPGGAARGRAPRTGTPRTALRHLRQSPRAAFAFVSVVVAHTTMAVIMTMTPVSMSEDGATLSVVGVTISGHLLGMYAFSPVVGWLADRYGHLPTALAGQAVFLVSAPLTGLSHGAVAPMMTGLFLLGLGWSFSLVAGSAMLTEATPGAFRPSMQGTTDTAMNVVAAVGAGLAGPLMHSVGFGGLNAVAAALVLPVLLYWFLLVRAR